MNSPVTRTPRAFGAHTAKDVPVTEPAGGVVGADVRTQDLPEVLVATLADQVQVDVAERRQPAVGVVDGPAVATGVGDLDAVVDGGSVEGDLEHPTVVDASHLVAGAVHDQDGGLGVRAQGAHDGARRRGGLLAR